MRKARVVNNTFQKHSQYQYIYFMKKVLTIPIPINELKTYAILSPVLSAILFWLQQLKFKNTLSRPIAIVQQTSVYNYCKCLCMDIHWPTSTAKTKVSPFCSCTQKQHHLKMFTGQTESKSREDLSTEGEKMFCSLDLIFPPVKFKLGMYCIC